MRPSGADEVRGQLLLEAIADRESVTVTDEEIAKHIEASAKLRNMAPAKLRAQLQRDGRLDGVTYTIRQDKVLKFLVDHATVTEVDRLSEPGVAVSPKDEPEHVHGPDCDH
jgi:trigger factor